ncbi:MAG: EAL domain-containing protein [Acidimicrobiia bacterium]|nr:EAL domain-containing protein [Acidimicrobiia bacterium]
MGLAIDDFGTGYSALSHLKRFPFDTLKIDRSFIDGLGRDPEDEAIVAAVVGVARALDLKVIAEGIETDGQLSALRARECVRVRGSCWGARLRPQTSSRDCAADGRAAGAGGAGWQARTRERWLPLVSFCAGRALEDPPCTETPFPQVAGSHAVRRAQSCQASRSGWSPV